MPQVDPYCKELQFLELFAIAGVEPSQLLLRLFLRLLYQPWIIDYDEYGAVRGMNEWKGKP
jgi:hypothetical protein